MTNHEYGIFHPETNRWLFDYDPNYLPADELVDYPTGVATWTDSALGAKRFASMIDAFEFWRQQSTTMPLRPDGQPNRPLTHYTISIEVLK
jgi:hypothetical protein